MLGYFRRYLKWPQKPEEKRQAEPSQAWAPALLLATSRYLCSLRQVHDSVGLEVILVLPAEHSSDDDDDDRDHGDGCQHCGDDPQVVGRILHHGCGKEPEGSM